MLWATFDSQELVRRGHVFVRYSLRQVLRMGLKTATYLDHAESSHTYGWFL